MYFLDRAGWGGRRRVAGCGERRRCGDQESRVESAGHRLCKPPGESSALRSTLRRLVRRRWGVITVRPDQDSLHPPIRHITRNTIALFTTYSPDTFVIR